MLLFILICHFRTVVDRNNQIRLVKSEISQAQYLVVQQQNELRQLVILELNKLILNEQLLVLKAKKLESVKVNMQMGETQFLNGVIPLLNTLSFQQVFQSRD